MNLNPIIHAARVANKLHDGQVRKYTLRSYIEHPGRVAARISRHPRADETWVAAAWLHDVLEDCAIDANQLAEKLIGEMRIKTTGEIVMIVRELTNPSKAHPELNRNARKAMDRAHLAECSLAARCIKLADRIDNLNEMDGAPLSFLKLYHDESVALSAALEGTDPVLEQELHAATMYVLGVVHARQLLEVRAANKESPPNPFYHNATEHHPSGWYFRDESDDMRGPYTNKIVADAALAAYCAHL
jgi:predicted HD phosphohydrolase